MGRLVCRLIISAAERLSEKWIFGREAKLRGQIWNFEDNLSAKDIISQHTSKPERGLFFYNHPINFHIAPKPLAKSQYWSDDKWAQLLRASQFERLNYISTVIRSKLDRLWCKLNFCSVPKYLAFFSASVFYCLLCNFWNNISEKLSNVTIAKLYKKRSFLCHV